MTHIHTDRQTHLILRPLPYGRGLKKIPCIFRGTWYESMECRGDTHGVTHKKIESILSPECVTYTHTYKQTLLLIGEVCALPKINVEG